MLKNLKKQKKKIKKSPENHKKQKLIKTMAKTNNHNFIIATNA